jgi:demethylmenaquinone methyltransferase/2-methoxy-6-polyprenyl-1,4-benzoquinol methylase
MFDAIAPTYDLLNGVLSFGIDRLWRRRLIRSLGEIRGCRILDVACGSGDLLVAFSSQQVRTMAGADIAVAMLGRAASRMAQSSVPCLLVAGAAEALPFQDATFDIATVAFGFRNFEDPAAGLRELYRVLRRGGRLRILEFSEPPPGLWGTMYRWYFRNILPRIGAWVSGHPAAYSYLPDSVRAFPSGPAVLDLLDRVGFKNRSCSPMSGGIATLYAASKEPDLVHSQT